jgi:diguanylate cyclase (GGDEF)-like protein
MTRAPLQASASDLAGPVSGCSEFEDVLAQGFKTLQFPLALEARYLQDKASDRLRLIRLGAIFALALNFVLLLADWFMVPDQFQMALALRLLIQAPLTIVGLFCLPAARRSVRELLAFVLGLMAAGITCYLSVTSTAPLAPDYLVVLFMIALFNGGVIRMRFWMAVRAACMVMAIFLFGVLLVPNPPVAVLISAAVVMVSSAVFALFSSYRSEHEERANWLMSQHQELLHEEVAHSNRQLHRLSRFDPLTDMANRRHFDEFLQQVWSRARCDGKQVALLMIDIDHFKHYNDRYGHVQGDLCLQEVAKALKGHLRQPEDLIARYGGEEFVAVIPGATMDMAMAAANRVRQGVADLKLAHEASPGLKQVTLSIGVACMRGNEADASPEHLIAAADAALYRAKEIGRNAVFAFDQRDLQNSLPPSNMATTAMASAEPPPRDAQHDLLEMTQTSLEQAWSRLSFPAGLERQFQQDCARDRLHYFAVCGLVAFVVFNGFLLTDYLLVADVFWLAVQVRLFVFTPLAVTLLCLCWFGREWLLKKPPMLTEGIITLSGVAAAASLAYILSASHLPTSQLYNAGLPVIIIYGNLVQRLRFWYATVFSGMVLAIHLGGLLFLPTFNPRLTLPLLMMTVTSVLFTLMANHALERDQRRRYLLTLNQTYILKQLEEVRLSLQTLSRVDALTGLFNRRHFHDYLQQVWQRAQHSGDDLAIIILDVDHFKKFNDRYGHQAGDVCLTRIAQAMKGCLRQPGDLVARLGGEEFIAVLPQTNLTVAQAAAERIRQAVEALQIPHEDASTSAMVTVSVGVASGPAQTSQPDARLITAADEALYQAKRAGRNRVVASVPVQ